jgi:hypothetical protein
MINEGCREVIFRAGLIQVSKIHAYMNVSLFFIHKNGIGCPFNQGDWVDKASVKKFFYLFLNRKGHARIDSSNSLSNRFRIWVGFNLMFDNSRVDSWHLFI